MAETSKTSKMPVDGRPDPVLRHRRGERQAYDVKNLKNSTTNLLVRAGELDRVIWHGATGASG